MYKKSPQTQNYKYRISANFKNCFRNTKSTSLKWITLYSFWNILMKLSSLKDFTNIKSIELLLQITTTEKNTTEVTARNLPLDQRTTWKKHFESSDNKPQNMHNNMEIILRNVTRNIYRNEVNWKWHFNELNIPHSQWHANNNIEIRNTLWPLNETERKIKRKDFEKKYKTNNRM